MATTLTLKQLSRDAIAAALDKAERYRLLNEPHEAESICLDVIAIDPVNQRALVTLLLALTDQFGEHLGVAFDEAVPLIDRLADEYGKAYYEGILCERRAKVHLQQTTQAARHAAFDWFQRALASYEQAERLRPSGNDDAILRWNTCARILMRHPELSAPEPEDTSSPPLE